MGELESGMFEALSKALDLAGVGLCRLDEEGRVESLNGQARRLLSLPGDGAAAPRLEDLFRPQVRTVSVSPSVHLVLEDTCDQLELKSAAVEAAANGIIIADANGIIAYVNPAFTRMTGYQAAEVVGRHTRLLRSGRHPIEFYQALWATILDGRTWHGTFINRRKDGTEYYEEATITPVVGPAGAHHYIAVKRDVTARAAADSERLRADALLAARMRLLEFAAAHPVRELHERVLAEVSGLTGSRLAFCHFVVDDPRLASLEGWSRSTVRDFCLATGVSGDDPAAAQALWLEAVRARAPVVHNDPPAGGPTSPRTLVVPVVRGGQVVAVVGVGDKPGPYDDADITGASLLIDAAWEMTLRKLAEAERERLRTTVAQSDRLASMGLLAAGVAHEINNPLAYVLYNLETVLRDLPQYVASASEGRPVEAAAWADLQQRLDETLSGTNRIREIARGLGAFSRVEKAEARLVDLRNPLNSAANIAFNEIKYRARLERDLGAVGPVRASDGRLSQVFLNLLINAAHATPEGAASKNVIRVRTWQEGHTACASVEDTGSGIPREHLGRIFEPFFTTKPAGVGSGLGLSIVRDIVSGYGGSIEVDSEVGRGSRFVVRLPLAADASLPAEAPEVLDAPALRGRVLVIDDEPRMRSALRRLLSEHEVVESGSGEEAWALLSADQTFDLVLCDVMMPQMSGPELHQRMRSRYPGLAERVLFITGGAFTPASRAYVEQARSRCLDKPVDAQGLRRAVAEAVRAARAQSAPPKQE